MAVILRCYRDIEYPKIEKCKGLVYGFAQSTHANDCVFWFVSISSPPMWTQLRSFIYLEARERTTNVRK
jgi:hypothetical protein